MPILRKFPAFTVVQFCALLATMHAYGGDTDAGPTVRITILTLNNGDVVQCLKVNTATIDEQTIYNGTTVEGKRAEYTSAEVKSMTSADVAISSLSDLGQKTIAKNAKKDAPVEVAKKSSDATPAAPVTPTVPGTSSVDPKTVARIAAAVADEKKKYDAAVEAIMDEGRKAVAAQDPLDAAAKKIDAQATNLDTEIDAAQRGLNTPKQSQADIAAWNNKLRNAQSRRNALQAQKATADQAAADQDKKVSDLVATKDQKLAKLKTDFDGKSAEIKAKFEKEDAAAAAATTGDTNKP